MKKTTATILSLCALCAFAMPKAAGFSAPVSAVADATEQNTRASGTELLAPSSYEQYLSLRSPADVAVTDEYTVIADGNALRVFDRESGAYLQYEHTQKITRIQFGNGDSLYFLDEKLGFFTLRLDELDKGETKADSLSVTCSTFIIADSTLYYSYTSGSLSFIYKAPLNNLSATTKLWEKFSAPPMLAYYNNALYYIDSGEYLKKYNSDSAKNDELLIDFPSSILSMSISENVLACVSDKNEFFVYDLDGLSSDSEPIFKSTGGYTALSTYGKYVYVIQNKSVKRYSVAERKFTDYEIGANSSSVNRLNGATDLYLSGKQLFIADTNNRRISVFNTDDKSFDTPVSTDFSVKYVVSDNQTLLAASSSEATLYSLSEENYGEKIAEKTNFAGNVVGTACVYGAYYLVTDKNFFYGLTAENETYAWSSEQKSLERTPSLLTSDVYGNLYVAYDTSVYLYEESDFVSMSVSETALTNALPAQTEKLCVDYEKNLYALNNGEVYAYGTTNGTSYTRKNTISLKESLVYGGNATATSFALSVEENQTYVLYDGNCLARTSKLSLPTVRNISVGDASDKIFQDETDFSVVVTNPNALAVEFDFDKLQNADVFPYLAFERKSEPFTALKIGNAGMYGILAVYDESTNAYKTYLVANESYRTLSRSQYENVYEQSKTGYLAGDAPLYKYPFLAKKLSSESLSRGTTLSLLGEIKLSEREYYCVSYEKDGIVRTGYLPKAYVTFANEQTNPTELVLGDTHSKTDAYGRLIYILLGGAAICVLTDFLLIRSFKNKEN